MQTKVVGIFHQLGTCFDLPQFHGLVQTVYLRLRMFTSVQHGRIEMTVNKTFNYESHNIRHFVVINATGKKKGDILTTVMEYCLKFYVHN